MHTRLLEWEILDWEDFYILQFLSIAIPALFSRNIQRVRGRNDHGMFEILPHLHCLYTRE